MTVAGVTGVFRVAVALCEESCWNAWSVQLISAVYGPEGSLCEPLNGWTMGNGLLTVDIQT